MFDFYSWWHGRALRNSWRRFPLCFNPGVPPRSPCWCPACRTSSVGTQREAAPGSCPSTGMRTTTTRCSWGSMAPRATTMSMTTRRVSEEVLNCQSVNSRKLLYFPFYLKDKSCIKNKIWCSFIDPCRGISDVSEFSVQICVTCFIMILLLF